MGEGEGASGETVISLGDMNGHQGVIIPRRQMRALGVITAPRHVYTSASLRVFRVHCLPPSVSVEPERRCSREPTEPARGHVRQQVRTYWSFPLVYIQTRMYNGLTLSNRPCWPDRPSLLVARPVFFWRHCHWGRRCDRGSTADQRPRGDGKRSPNRRPRGGGAPCGPPARRPPSSAPTGHASDIRPVTPLRPWGRARRPANAGAPPPRAPDGPCWHQSRLRQVKWRGM